MQPTMQQVLIRNPLHVFILPLILVAVSSTRTLPENAGNGAHTLKASRPFLPTASLICQDHDNSCASVTPDVCNRDKEVSMSFCKVACSSCDAIAKAVAAHTGIPVKIYKKTLNYQSHPRFCSNTSPACSLVQQQGLCKSEPRKMLANCQASCGFCNDTFMHPGDHGLCTDSVHLCPYYAMTGLCDAGLDWPQYACRRSCGLCKPSQLLPLSSASSNIADLQDCVDYKSDCRQFAAKGMCTSSSRYMMVYCRSSCDLCHVKVTSRYGYMQYAILPRTPTPPSGSQQDCKDMHTLCPTWAAVGGCSSNSTVDLCKDSCGVCQSYRIPMTVYRLNCRDKSANCKGWTTAGECTRNPAFMSEQCQLSCGGCDHMWTPKPPPYAILAPRVMMPMIGFGTAGLGGDTQQAVVDALRAGYRLIDSAQAREWYAENVIGAVLNACDIARKDLFLTSKLHPRHLGFQSTLTQFEQSLKDLHTSYLDLFLLHYPECWGSVCGGSRPKGTWQDSWRALELLYKQRKVRAIGVSNFNIQQMEELMKIAQVKPAVLQTNSDPINPNTALQKFCYEHGVQFQGYSSLGTQHTEGGVQNPVLTAKPVVGIAAKFGVSPAQVLLRWALQHGQAVIPRSHSYAHMAMNLKVMDDFTLSLADMMEIDSLEGQLGNS